MHNVYAVGQKVYVKKFCGSGYQYTPGDIVNVTPSGMLDVKYASGFVERFSARGARLACRPENTAAIDSMTFESRSDWLEHKASAKKLGESYYSTEPL